MKKAYTSLSDLHFDTEDGTDSMMGYINVVEKDSETTYAECDHAGFHLRDRVGDSVSFKDVLPADTVSAWKINDSAYFVFDDTPYPSKQASYVILLDEEEYKKGLFRCPVCASTGPFQTFPRAEFDMDASGAMNVPEGMAVDPDFEGDTPCNCKQCDLKSTKDVFNVTFWDEYTGELPEGIIS